MAKLGCAFLLALASGVAGRREKNVLSHLTFRARNGAVQKIMDQITALIETHQSDGPSEAFDKSAATFVSNIDNDVAPLVQQAREDTLSAIKERMALVSATTATAVEKKQGADEADDVWWRCVEVEKSKRVAVEDAETALDEAEDRVHEPCNREIASSPFSAERSLAKFTCDIEAQGGNCDQQMSNYVTMTNDMVGALRTDMGKKEELYTQAVADCSAARKDVEDKTAQRDAAIEAWRSQQSTCLSEFDSREAAICDFEGALQQKCVQVDEYRGLMSNIDGTGTEFSESDRMQEWSQVQVSRCLLSGQGAGGATPTAEIGTTWEINEATLAWCESTIDYGQQVGVLGPAERETAEFERLTSGDNFNCDESSMTFGGRIWQLPSPEEEAPPSGAYVSNEYSVDPFDPRQGCSSEPIVEQCVDGDVRLLDSGIPEVFQGGSFRPICGHYFWNNQEGASTFCSSLGSSSGGRYEKITSDYEADAVNVGACKQGEPLTACTAGGNAFGDLDYRNGWCNRGAQWGGKGIAIHIICEEPLTRSSSCGFSGEVEEPEVEEPEVEEVEEPEVEESAAEDTCVDGDVRLLESGIPEVFSGGEFRPICGHYFWDNQNGASTFCSSLGVSSGGVWIKLDSDIEYEADAVNVGRCNPGQPLNACTAGGNAFTDLNYRDGWCNKGAKYHGRTIAIHIECEESPPRSSSCGSGVH